MRIADIPLGDGAPLVLIAGLNVIETAEETLETAQAIARLARRHDFPVVFKASFDKANRSSLSSFRGPGIDEGLRILAQVKRQTGLALLTDVHEPPQAKLAADVVDCLQVPAFLCRQTDLLAACAATGLPVNIKKGQFMAPQDMRLAADKVRSLGPSEVFVTERGTSFGYQNLVADLRALPLMRAFAPVCFDATHSVQEPGRGRDASGGDRVFVAPLARAAVAVGVDALFVETHPEPERAPCDGAIQIGFDALDALLAEVRAIERALVAARASR
jgi:2-dehydro-3-deoxyphosphooctonate aldolase (KDO 8-P synthase)